jgi:hypothetical protein
MLFLWQTSAERKAVNGFKLPLMRDKKRSILVKRCRKIAGQARFFQIDQEKSFLKNRRMSITYEYAIEHPKNVG